MLTRVFHHFALNERLVLAMLEPEEDFVYPVRAYHWSSTHIPVTGVEQDVLQYVLLSQRLNARGFLGEPLEVGYRPVYFFTPPTACPKKSAATAMMSEIDAS